MSIENVDSLKKELSIKIKDLYFPSESDVPIETFAIKKDGDIIATLKQLHPDKASQIAEEDLTEFYEKYGVEKDWQNANRKHFAKQFGESINLMKENLENVKVYRLGEVRVDIYIVGESHDGNIVGLKTGAIET